MIRTSYLTKLNKTLSKLFIKYVVLIYLCSFDDHEYIDHKKGIDRVFCKQ